MGGGPPTAEAAEPRSGAPGDGDTTPQARKRRRLRLRRAITLAAAAALLAAATTWLLYGSPWLRLNTVDVTGTRVLTPAQVRAAAAVPLDGPLVSVDTGAVARRLRVKLPRVDSVDVTRSWPHTLTLKVTERIPAALVPRADGSFTEVDDDGVQFATVTTRTAPENVPLLKLAPDPAATASTHYFGTKRLLRAGVEVAEDLPPAVRREARLVTVAGYDSITVELTGGRTVNWGSPEEGARKAAALTALLKVAKNARDFDVSAPTAPAVSGG